MIQKGPQIRYHLFRKPQILLPPCHPGVQSLTELGTLAKIISLLFLRNYSTQIFIQKKVFPRIPKSRDGWQASLQQICLDDQEI